MISQSKFVVFCGWIIVIAIILASCHILQQPSTPLITIKLSGWGSSLVEKKLLSKMLQDFEAQHSQIKVKYEVISQQYMDVIKTRLIGEAAPDVFYLDALEAPFFMSKNILEPLDTYIKPEFDLGDFQENLLSSFRYKNHIYGFPKDYSTLVLFYNKDSFTATGLNNPPISWEQLRIYAAKLTDRLNKQAKYGFGDSIELSHQAYKITAFGGNITDNKGNISFTSEASLQGLQLSIDQYQKDQSSALKSDLGASSSGEMFAQSKVAMAVDGSWAIPYLQETFPNLHFATAELPTINGNKSTVSFTVAYVMNHQTKHKAEAWQLISYLTGKEGMTNWAKTGFALPTRKSVVKKLHYDKDPLRLPLLKGTDYAIPWQIGEYPTVIINNFENQFISAFLKEQPLKQAMMKAECSANQQIKAMR